MTEQNEIEKKWPGRVHLLHNNEIWLSEQASKGLMLKRFDDSFAYFEESAGENIHFRMMVLNEKNAEKQIKVILSQGFSLVESYKKYYIFRIDGKYSHITPSLNEETIGFTRKWFNRLILGRFFVTIVFFAAVFIQLFLHRGKLIQGIVEVPIIGWILVFLLLAYGILNCIIEYRLLIREKRYYLKQEAFSPVRSSKRSRAMKIFFIAICVFAVALLIKGVYFDKEQQFSIHEVQEVMPIIALQDIDEAADAEINEAALNEADEDHHAEIKHSLLAPRQYRAWQHSSGNVMHIFYYEVAFEPLADRLARELPIYDFMEIKQDDLEKVDVAGLDAVYLWHRNDFSSLSARKGKRVMHVFLVGDIPVEDVLNKIAEIM